MEGQETLIRLKGQPSSAAVTTVTSEEGNCYLLELIHQDEQWSLGCRNLSEPTACPWIVDEGRGNPLNLPAAAASGSAIHIIYQFYDGKLYSLKHKILQNNQITEMTLSLGREFRDNLSPAVVADVSGNFHLAWLGFDGLDFRVCYRQYRAGGWLKGGWQAARKLSLPGLSGYAPVIITRGQLLMVVWQQYDGVYFSFSEDEGENWSQAEAHRHLTALRDRYFSHLSLHEDEEPWLAWVRLLPLLTYLTRDTFRAELKGKCQGKETRTSSFPVLTVPSSRQLPAQKFRQRELLDIVRRRAVVIREKQSEIENLEMALNACRAKNNELKGNLDRQKLKVRETREKLRKLAADSSGDLEALMKIYKDLNKKLLFNREHHRSITETEKKKMDELAAETSRERLNREEAERLLLEERKKPFLARTLLRKLQ